MTDFSYAPDLPPETPNVWMVCDGFHPDIYGNYRTGFLTGTNNSTSATGQTIPFHAGMAYAIAAGTPQMLLCGIDSGVAKVYVYASGWNRRDGGFVNANGGHNSEFLQVGNITLAVGSANNIASRDATTTNNFAAVASSPLVTGMVIGALNIVLGINTGSDGWATSDTSAPTIWTGGECASGNLRHTSGNITAAVPFGNDFIVFKSRGIYRGTYVGGIIKWSWALIDSEKGAFGQSAACFGAGRVWFIGEDGAYSYDGSAFKRIDRGIWRTLRTFAGSAYIGGANPATTIHVKLAYDARRQSVFLFSPGYVNTSVRSNGAGFGEFYSYNIISGKWGHQSTIVENNGSQNFTAFIENWRALEPFTSSDYNTDMAVFSSTNNLIYPITTSFNASDLPGTNYKPKLRTSRIGTRGRMTKVSRAIPEWTISDGAGTNLSTATVKTATPYTSDAPMGSETAGTPVPLSTNLYRADYLLTARFQSVEIAINAEAVIAGVTFAADDVGPD